MILRNFCCCFQSKTDKLQLESKPCSNEVCKKDNNDTQIPSRSVTVIPEVLTSENNNVDMGIFAMNSEQEAIVKQPKSDCKIQKVDNEVLKTKQHANDHKELNLEYILQSHGDQELSRIDSNANNYEGFNNFGFVDEIDSSNSAVITSANIPTANIKKGNLEVINNNSNIVNIKKQRNNYYSDLDIEDITMKNERKTKNMILRENIDETVKIEKDYSLKPPSLNEPNFEERCKIMIEKSFEEHFQSFNVKPQHTARTILHSKKDHIDGAIEIPKIEKYLDLVDQSIQISCLEAHNRLRAQHGCPQLKQNDELNKLAMDWAIYLHKNNCKLIHRPNNKYGENLYWTNNRNGHVTMAVHAWYEEIKLYNFNNPTFSKETGHFTQLLWRDTLELGTAVVKDGSGMIVVCNYSPPGNYNGEFNDYTVPQLIAEDRLTNDMIQYYIKKIRESSLATHNRFRALHGSPSLQRCDELDRVAEEMLDHIENHNGKIPKLTKDFGRNCFWSQNPFVHVTEAIQFWYDDGIKLYNYDKPKQENDVGGFAQLIWRDTLHLGTGIRRINNYIYVLCVYNPSRRTEDMFDDYFIPRPIHDKLHMTLEKCSEQMRSTSLETHNRLRALHGCPPIVGNSELDKLAEEWAKHLAVVNKLYHRPNSKYGENLYWTSDKLGHVTVAIQSWYDEIKLYDFNNPDFSTETGHFTQLIWKDSIELGTGISRRGESLYVVCVYNPPGNFVGRFNDYYIPRPISR